ncbi:MAG: N-glycosylase/DNA lyase [Candidatus Nanoarchaeia archaeon]
MGMQELVNKINSLDRHVRANVEKRIKEFEHIEKDKMFSELCFCLMTANFDAEKCIRLQNKLERDFSKLDENALYKRLKAVGYRFPNRAAYIVEARQCKLNLDKNGKQAREQLLAVKGLGMKEASHFLRNIGYKDVAIIDFHILDLLERGGLIAGRKLNKKRYLEIEGLLEKLAEKAGLDLARLDLYLWYLETGKVLK